MHAHTARNKQQKQRQRQRGGKPDADAAAAAADEEEAFGCCAAAEHVQSGTYSYIVLVLSCLLCAADGEHSAGARIRGGRRGHADTRTPRSKRTEPKPANSKQQTANDQVGRGGEWRDEEAHSVYLSLADLSLADLSLADLSDLVFLDLFADMQRINLRSCEGMR